MISFQKKQLLNGKIRNIKKLNPNVKEIQLIFSNRQLMFYSDYVENQDQILCGHSCNTKVIAMG